MAGCVTGKKMYSTQAIAEDVLIDAWVKYRFTEGRGPVAVYRCDDCHQYHLTSSGEMNEKLSLYIKEGKIKLQKEAEHWEQKLKKR
jgi:hypothetical protein